MPNDELPSIDPAQLAAVTGGTGTTDDAVTQMLQQLMSSIKDLAQNQSGGSNNQFMQMLPIMMMMMNRNQQAAPAPYPEPPPGDGWVRVA